MSVNFQHNQEHIYSLSLVHITEKRLAMWKDLQSDAVGLTNLLFGILTFIDQTTPSTPG